MANVFHGPLLASLVVDLPQTVISMVNMASQAKEVTSFGRCHEVLADPRSWDLRGSNLNVSSGSRVFAGSRVCRVNNVGRLDLSNRKSLVESTVESTLLH